MVFTGNEDHRISLADAAKLTGNYRKQMSGNDIKGQFFGGDALNNLLNQIDCVGIRIYNGLTDNGIPCYVITGVRASGNDIYGGLILEKGLPCPPDCGESNILNTD